MEETLKKTEFDYTYVDATARIALYDDLHSAPRVTKIEPAETTQYIENLAVTIHEQSKLAGGRIPYSVIREVSENFIHAQFREIVVSILDDGNTIRFADQGPGIQEKEKAQKPGFTSAIEPMKDYIRGVGSGFPIVKDYLDDREGSIVIEDNLNAGAVVTISLMAQPSEQPAGEAAFERGVPLQAGAAFQPFMQPKPDAERMQVGTHIPMQGHVAAGQTSVQQTIPAAIPLPRIPLDNREEQILKLLLEEGILGITEIHNLTGVSPSSVHNKLKKLEESGLVERAAGKKRGLTPYGQQVAIALG